MSKLRSKFQRDLDEIAINFVNLYGLKFNQEAEQLSDPLSRWIDFRLRYLDPIPREIFLSTKFPKNTLPLSVVKGLSCLCRKIEEGEDINGYQSKAIIRFNDFSGENRIKRTDLLWADWGISHLHITDNPSPVDDFFMDRKCRNGECWLLFCLFAGNTVGFIDIRKHDEKFLFSDYDLITTIKESWPKYMDNFRLNGVLGSKKRYTNEEILALRKNGISPSISIDGEVFIGPGLGITTASTATRVTQTVDRIRDWVDSLADLAMDPNGQLQEKLASRKIDKLDLSLCITPKGISVYENNSDCAFTFGNTTSALENNLISTICPDWALRKLLSKNKILPI